MIFQILESLAQEIGIPQQIVSDHGSDIKKGVELFCQLHRNPSYNYDITHKLALLLKGILEPCHTWQEFLTQCSVTRNQILKTHLAFLMPPSLRDKSRYLNLDKLVKWAENLLAYQARSDFSQISTVQCINQLAISQLQLDDPLMANKLELLQDNVYPDVLALQNAITDTLGVPLESQQLPRIVKYTDLGQREFTEKFGWINNFDFAIDDYSQ